MNNLQLLTKEVQKICPEILELKFGCIVNIGNKAQAHFVTVLRQLESNDYNYNQHTNRKYSGVQKIIEFQDNFSVERTPIGEIFEILGSDITLEHVLKALRSVSEKIEGKVFISDIGEIVISKVGNEIKLKSVWHLGKPLHLQPQETIDSLTKLICK